MTQQNQWQAQNVRRYRISVLKVQSIRHAQTHTITVEDGRVRDQFATCAPAPFEVRSCEVQPVDANEFTVEGLLRTILAIAPESEKHQLHVTFDGQYHFPKIISRDQKQLVHGELVWRVVSFQPVP